MDIIWPIAEIGVSIQRSRAIKSKKETFWSNFKASAQRRNNIIHNSLIVEKAEAEHSLQAGTDLVAHLNK